MDLANAVQRHREEILRIARRHGVTRVQVFGSVVRGQAGLDSDLDLLVERGGERTMWWPGGLIAELEDLLGRKVDVVTAEGLHPLIREAVRREARPL
jgi:hypothetical protein